MINYLVLYEIIQTSDLQLWVIYNRFEKALKWIFLSIFMPSNQRWRLSDGLSWSGTERKSLSQNQYISWSEPQNEPSRKKKQNTSKIHKSFDEREINFQQYILFLFINTWKNIFTTVSSILCDSLSTSCAVFGMDHHFSFYDIVATAPKKHKKSFLIICYSKIFKMFIGHHGDASRKWEKPHSADFCRMLTNHYAI